MWHEILHILSDPAHVASELVWEVTFLLLGISVSNWRLRREHRRIDREHDVVHDEA